MITSILSLSLFKTLIFAFSSNPGKTLLACKSPKSFPPNSIYSLSWLLTLSSIYLDCMYHIFFEFLCNSSKDKRYKKKRTDPWSLQMVYCDKYIFCVIEDN